MRKTNLLKVKQNYLRKWASGVTQARIAQDRSGCSLSTQEILKFKLDAALARDAIHHPWDPNPLMNACAQKGFKTLLVNTRASSREEYLLDPKSGSYLNREHENALKEENQIYDIVITVTNGLSTCAIEQNFYPFLNQFYIRACSQFEFIPIFISDGYSSEIGTAKLKSFKLTVSPIIFAANGRVALSDHLGVLFHSKISIIFVGERPGLSAFDSMGIYLTYEPKLNCDNSHRNCISNIRPPHGLGYNEASAKLFNLIEKCLKFKCSGTKLKL